MPDGGPELTLITPGRVGRGAGGRPPRAGVGLTTAVILHPRTPARPEQRIKTARKCAQKVTECRQFKRFDDVAFCCLPLP